jgi:hypothetical protein
VGVYLVTAHTVGDANNNAEDSLPNALRINKATATIVVTAYCVDFDGSAHTATGTATGVLSEALTGLVLTGTTHTTAGTYLADAWNFSDPNGNYSDQSGTVNDSIVNAAITAPVNAVTASTGNIASVAGAGTGATYSWSITNGTITAGAGTSGITFTAGGAGTLTLQVTVTNSLSCSSTKSANVTIAKADPTVTAIGGTFTYNGNPHAGSGSATGGGGVSLAVTLTYDGTGSTTYGPTSTAPSLAGTYTVTAHTAGDANNNAGDSSATALAINKFNPLMSALGGTGTYTGTPHAGSGQALGGAGESLPVTLSYSGTSGTTYGPTATPPANAGAYLVTTHTVGDANNNAGDSSPSALQINKATATIVVTAYCVDFDGSAHTATGTATGVLSEALTGLVLTGTTHTTAGTYLGDAWSFTNPNYSDAGGTVNDSIVNAAITAPVTSFTASTGNIASVAGAGAGATYNWSITNGTITAGTGTTGITFTSGAVGTLTLQVTVTTSASCASTKSASVTVAPVVTVTSVSPNNGTINGNTAVTITGTAFQSGANVTFGGSAATKLVVVNATSITAKTPAHTAGAVNVIVTNTDASTGTLTSGYTYKELFDANGDNTIDPSDIFYLVNYLFLNGPAPVGGLLSGDANGDGVVDPADIFYLVNYLFNNGPKPNSVPSPARIERVAGSLKGSISLGVPVLRGDRYVIPVIASVTEGSPSALALRLRFDRGAEAATIHRAGANASMQPSFEIMPHGAGTLSYIVDYDQPWTTTGANVIAEVEVPASVAARGVRIEIDPAVTLLSNRDGIGKATVANGTLTVSGTVIDGDTTRDRAPRSR